MSKEMLHDMSDFPPNTENDEIGKYVRACNHKLRKDYMNEFIQSLNEHPVKQRFGILPIDDDYEYTLSGLELKAIIRYCVQRTETTMASWAQYRLNCIGDIISLRKTAKYFNRAYMCIDDLANRINARYRENSEYMLNGIANNHDGAFPDVAGYIKEEKYPLKWDI